MNTFKPSNSAWKPGIRGFYTESKEDHITVALFECFEAFTEAIWLPELLRCLNIVAHNPTKPSWQYSFEARTEGKNSIADIVLEFFDGPTRSIVIIEAKRRGGKVDHKDNPANQRYLRMPAIRDYKNKYYRLLIDSGDVDRVIRTLGLADERDLITWQQLMKIQAAAIDAMGQTAAVRDAIRNALFNRYDDYGYGAGQADLSNLEHDQIDDQKLRNFMYCDRILRARKDDALPLPPFDYLARSPSCLDVYFQRHGPKQETFERQRPLWRNI